MSGQAQEQTESKMKTLTEMYESEMYSNLKKGLQQKQYELKDSVDCNEEELREKLKNHNVTGIAQNKFVNAVKATRKWQQQHSQSQSQSNGM